jgi:hypothetical protein
MLVATQPAILSSVLKHEYLADYCREAVTVLAGAGSPRALALGTVLGAQIVADAVAVTPGAGNTGNGAAGPVALDKDAEIGTYVLTATSATKFEVATPSGDALKTLTVGQAYASSHISLTIAAGGTAFAAGDSFAIAVTAAAGKVTAIDPDADDGRQKPFGILLAAATAPDGVDAAGVALVRGPAIVDSAALTWPGSMSAAQKSAALAQLAARGIIARSGV